MVERLNQGLLPERYFAETQVHIGGRVEVDVATMEHGDATSPPSSNGGVAVETWAPPRTSLRMPAVFPDEIEVQVFRESGGATLVAAVELVSPGNKDRMEARRAFAVKCANYLHNGVGLVVIDIVTERRANLHDDLIELLRQSASFCFSDDVQLYASAYHPHRLVSEEDVIDLWLEPLMLDAPLPTMPLALSNGPILPLELEATYMEARVRSRL
jgi:hypothetical protein